jgi:hypothetical protein
MHSTDGTTFSRALTIGQKHRPSLDPVVVCIGTDRVFQLGRPGGNGTAVSRDRVVSRFFEKSASLSAVIVVPNLLRPELFVGVARSAEAALLKNPRARFRLSESAENHLQQLDFNARTVSVWTEPRSVRASLRKAIDQLGGGLSVPSTTASPGPAHYSRPFTWSCTWRFSRLGIRRFGESYWLFDERTAREFPFR